MEINYLVDLNNLRSAPRLSKSQRKRFSEELETNIFNADWITVGIMASTDHKAIKHCNQYLKNILQLNLADIISYVPKEAFF